MNKDCVIENALITSANICLDRGFLTMYIGLELENGSQSFGGYGLYLSKDCDHYELKTVAGHFIYRVLEVAGVESINDLKGKTIRIRKKESWGSTIDAIGHIIKDDWFEPAIDFKEAGDD